MFLWKTLDSLKDIVKDFPIDPINHILKVGKVHSPTSMLKPQCSFVTMSKPLGTPEQENPPPIINTNTRIKG